MVGTEEIIRENTRRHRQINKPYNPLTGEGCQGERVCLRIKDAPDSIVYIPKPMMKEKICRRLKKYGSIEGIFLRHGIIPEKEDIETIWIEFCEKRIKYDFEFFAFVYQTIEDGLTAQDVPFRLNRGQRRLLDKLEKMRLSGMPIRIILLKARQWGGSTLTQLYMFWIQLVHRKNWNSVICGHLKDTAITIRSMFDKAIEQMPAIGGVKYSIKPFNRTLNIKEVPERGCRITVGSAEEPDSVRGQNAKLAHFSEVGLYPDTEKKKTADLIASVIGTMKRVPYTMVVYESTAKGVGDFFHTEWEKAKKGETAFEPVFVEWFLIDIYREPLEGNFYNHSGKKIKGSIEGFVKTLNDYEINLFNNYEGCTLENINWYRGKLSEMSSVALMHQEFPSNDIEAFQDSGLPAFRSEDIEALRRDCKQPVAIGDITSDCSPTLAKLEPQRRKEVLANVRFVEDTDLLHELATIDPQRKNLKEQNRLKVWEYPEYDRISNRYVVVVDTGGRSQSADYSVIAVFDRYYQMYGGVPEVVAEWRGHIDHDILVWLSAQIAVYYNNALLVIESNTHETEANEGDHAEFIFDTIAEYYENLYSRTPADKIKEGVPAKWGFHTNRSTKTMIMDNYVAILRERGYIERNEQALNEARVYEKKKNGAYGAKEGQHDDILMTRMIGCYICYDLPTPKVVDAATKRAKRIRPISEASL